MRYIKLLLLACILSAIALTSGCWNYREVDKLAIVSGLAFDRKDGKYLVTAEIVNISGGKDSKTSTELVTTEGITVFDAGRETIKLTGKRLYYSHAEIIIVSREIAEEGILPILDWISRDAEPRYTLHVLVSKEKSAKEILEQRSISSEVLSFELNDILESQKSLSNAMNVEEWQFINDLSAMGISATLPTVCITKDNNKSVPEITGTGVFRKDRLVGFLDGDETKTLMFIKDKIKGGLLVDKEYNDDSRTYISLEIFRNKTTLKPYIAHGKIMIRINTDTNVAIGENGGEENYIEEPGRSILKKDFEAILENKIKNLVKEAQEQYDSDIFGFGKSVKVNLPDFWRQIESKWEQVFKTVGVEVHSTINIKNSAFESKPIKVGD